MCAFQSKKMETFQKRLYNYNLSNNTDNVSAYFIEKDAERKHHLMQILVSEYKA